jgi:hypothetical protein
MGKALDAAANGIRTLIFGRMEAYLGKASEAFRAGLYKDLEFGITSAAKIMLKPLSLLFNGLVTAFKFLGTKLASWSPAIASDLMRLAPALERFALGLGKLALNVPILDAFGLVLTTGTTVSSGNLTPAEAARERANNARGGVHIEHLHFEIVHKDDDAAKRQFQSLLKSFGVGGHPAVMRSRGGASFGSPFLANPMTVAAPAR